MTTIRSAYVRFLHHAGALDDVSVADPALGALRGWTDIDAFAVDMFERVSTGDRIFGGSNGSLFDGSDGTVTVNVPGGIPVPYNAIRSAMHAAYGGANANQRTDGRYLRDKFAELMQGRIEFAGGNTYNDANVFTVQHSQGGPSERGFLGNPSGRTGVRNGNFSARTASKGQAADIQARLLSNRSEYEALLTSTNSCLMWRKSEDHDWRTTTPEETISVLTQASCVLLGIWMRFSFHPLADALVRDLGYLDITRRDANVGTKRPNTFRHKENKVMFLLMETVAKARYVSPLGFWRKAMGTPVIDTEIYAICKRFEIDILVLQNHAFSEFKRRSEAEDANGSSLVSKSEDMKEFIRDVKKIKVMIYFKGAREMAGAEAPKFDRRKGHCMIMVCSYLGDVDAHVDIVLDPRLEASLLGRRYTRMMFEMRYDDRMDMSASLGYFDRLVASLKSEPIVPMRMYQTLDTWDIQSCITKSPAPNVIFLEDEQACEEFMTTIVDHVRRLFPPHDVKQHPMFHGNKLFGSTVCIDVDCTDRMASNLFDMQEYGICGLVYFFGEFHRRFTEAGIVHKIDFGDFETSMSQSRSQRIFSHKIRNMEGMDRENDVDAVSSFDDVKLFSISLKMPLSVQPNSGRAVAVNRIFMFTSYSKSALALGMRIVKQDWVQKLITKRIFELADEAERDRPGWRMKVIQEKRGDKNIDVHIARRLARESITLAMLNSKPGLVTDINKIFSTFPSLTEETAYVYDPQLDEPVVSTGRLSDKRIGDVQDGFWEMDANLFYTQTTRRVFDGLLMHDFYGTEWISGSPRRARFYKLSFVGDDFIGSYEADFGYVHLKEIDFHPLSMWLGLNELCSWWRFASENPERVERHVPCASIIHFTAFVVREAKKKIAGYSGHGVRPWMMDKSDKEMWKCIQETVFNIKHVYLYHDEAQRIAIKRSVAFNPTTLSDRLDGIVIGERNARKMKKIGMALNDIYMDLTGLLMQGGMSKDEARSAVKLDFNRAIGMLKNGKLIGGLKLRPVSDVITMDEHEDTQTYTFGSIAYSSKSFVQICVRDLPMTNLCLSEMVHITPVTMSGYPRSLRIDVLERARLITDLFCFETKAFMTKTDAVFFHDDHLDDAVAFITGHFKSHYQLPTEDGRLLMVDAEDIRSAADECLDEECRPGKFCTKHSPVHVYGDSLNQLPPVKFVRHPGQRLLGLCDGLMESSVNIQQAIKYCGRIPEEEIVRKVSDNGRKCMADNNVPDPDSVCFTSSLMPTVEEMLELSLLVPCPRQEVGQDPSVFIDRVEEHCRIFGTRERVFIGDEGSAQPYEVDIEGRNKVYLDRLFEKMDSFRGGYLMEGPPGAGKSYALCRYIESKDLEAEKTTVFVATATHLTLAPYQVLRDRPNVHVCTIHSLIGVFNNMADVSVDPRSWFESKKTKHFSRLVRTRPNTPGSQVVIFIDEYEMLPLEVEEVLLYLSGRYKVVLLGDRFQTAAFGTGIRCGGDVARSITRGNRIEFDLPFRKPEYAYYVAQKEACEGEPSLFLEPPLSDYKELADRDTPAYQHLIDRIADAYMNAKTRNVVYKDPVVSLQNYKALGTVTLDILEKMSDNGYWSPGPEVFSGSDACGMGKKDEGELGTVDAQSDTIDSETDGQRKASEGIFLRRFSHKTNGDAGPDGKGFLVGTRMMYEPGFTYRALTAFVPSISGTHEVVNKNGIPEKKKKLQPAILMGQVMMLVSRETKRVPVETGNVNKRMTVDIAVDIFKNEDGSRVVLTREETSARMFYPFCLFTGGVVGHTFNDYAMVVFSSDSATQYAYRSLRRAVGEAESVLMDVSWVSPIVKLLNVTVSRLTAGNRVKIYEIWEGRAGFWKETVCGSEWHIYEEHRAYEYKHALLNLRATAVKASRKYQLSGLVGSIYSF